MKSRNQNIKLRKDEGGELNTTKKEINDKNVNVEFKKKNTKPEKKKNEPIKDVSNDKKANNLMNSKSKPKKSEKRVRRVDLQNKIYDKVVIDTAAGIHLVHNKDWLLDYAPLIKAPEYWGVGDDKNPIEILGEGILPIKGGRNNVIGVTAYYSPKQDATILSADKLYQETGITLDKGYKSLVSEEKDFDTKTLKLGNTVWVDTCEIIDVKTHDKKIRAVRPINPLTIKPNITLLEAHLRLNHFPATGIIKSIEMNNFDDVKMIKEEKKGGKIWCEICSSGKLHRHFHYTGSMNHYTAQKEPGASWSLDLFGPVEHVRERYLLVMVDSVSRFVIATTHVKKNKNEIGEQIGYNINWIEKQFDTKVKELIMDRGKEFDNELVERIAHENGINIIYTSTEDHQANGRAERGIRTIIEDTRTLLLQSRLPLRFWTYAAKAAVNVRNCVYNKNVGESPLMNISKNKVKIKLRSFIPFGAPALVWDHRSKKTEAPGKRAITLSKDPKGFGYYFYVPKERKIISTTNYILPDYTINHELTGKDNGQDIIGTFLDEVKNKIGDVRDMEYDENEIITSLPSDIESEHDELVNELQEDEIRVKEYLLNDTQEEIDNVSPIVEPRKIENTNLDELFEDIDVDEEPLNKELEPKEEIEENPITPHDPLFTEQEKNDNTDMDVYTTDTESNTDNHEQSEDDSNCAKEPLMTKLNDILTNDAEIEEIDENTVKESMRISNDYALSKVNQNHQTAKELDTNIQPALENGKNIIQQETNDLTNVNEEEKTEEYIAEELNNNEHLNTIVDQEEIKPVKPQTNNHLVNHTKKSSKSLRSTNNKLYQEFSNTFKKMLKQKIENEQNKKKELEDEPESTPQNQEQEADNLEKEKENILENKREEFFDTIDSIPTVERSTPEETNSMKPSYVNTWKKKDFPSLKKPNNRDLRQRLLDNHLQGTNIDNIPKINAAEAYNTVQDLHPKKIFKKKKVIRYITPAEGWEELSPESRGEIVPQRKIRALFYKQAITETENLPEKIKFIEAYNKELNNLVNMKVIDLNIAIDKNKVPKDKIIGINSIFTIKRDGTYKARIVCRGDQQASSSYDDIETSILSLDSLRILLIIANNKKMRLRTLDINHAFLYATLNEELYITHPKNARKVTPLRKALYGLKQSPKRWNETLKDFMNEMGLYDSIYSPGLFVSKNGNIMIAAYVDDCIVAARTEQDLDEFIKKLETRFSLKIVGTMKNNVLDTDILGMDLHYNYEKGNITLSMESYIRRLKDDYPMILNDNMIYESIPNIDGYKLNPKNEDLIMKKDEYKKKVKYLQELIGKLNYIRSRGRIDLEFPVSKIARLVLYPHKKVFEIIEKILKYVYTTKDMKIVFRREEYKNLLNITVISDASLASEFDLKSRCGALIWIGNNFFHGFSKKSSILCSSSAEAELDAINYAEKIALLLKLKLEKLMNTEKINITLITDSKPALDWLKQDYFKARTKFLGLRIERLKERIKDKDVKLRKINGKENPADPLTKSTSVKDFKKLKMVLQHELTPKELLPITVLWNAGNGNH